MNFHHRASRRLVTGKSGSGKTTYFLECLMRSRARWIFVFDPEREVASKLGWPTAVDVPRLNYCVVNQHPVCFDPAPLFPGARAEGFAFFCRYVLSVSRELNGTKLLAVDEMQTVQSPGPGGIPQSLCEIMDEGRRHEIDCLFIAQSVNRVNDRVRVQLTEIITFCHTDRLPLAWLEQDGFDATEIASLPVPGGYVLRNLQTGEIKKRYGNRVHASRKASGRSVPSRG